MSVSPAPKSIPQTAARNSCKMCAPLGASLAFRGVEGGMALIHGSQGCATYIRRHLIGHFREPIDIASSSFTEHSAVFGGQKNLFKALDNITRQYNPSLIGIASSCLSETLGEDVRMMIARYRKDRPTAPFLVPVSTPSYRGTHTNGFNAATRALVETLAVADGDKKDMTALFPGLVSCADLRHLKSIMADFGLDSVVLPDYSDTLDAPVAVEYEPIAAGGTPLSAIRELGRAKASISFGGSPPPVARPCRGRAAGEEGSPPAGASYPEESAGRLLEQRYKVPHKELEMPIGVKGTDAFFSALSDIAERMPHPKYLQARGRLIDSYVDAHKYLFGARAVIYGDESFVIAMTRFVSETGIRPVLCATGGGSPAFRTALGYSPETVVMENADFVRIEEQIEESKPDLLIGGSRGYAVARRLDIPLVRAGFPIHDRIGAQRMLHVGYEGTQQLFDRIVNALLRARQDASPVGYLNM